MPLTTAATSLRHTLENTQSLISAPGVYDGLSARVALNVGFDALYMVLQYPSPTPTLFKTITS